jgi:hypothetical protein
MHGYPGNVCAASRCNQQTEVIIGKATGRWSIDVPLCDDHWGRLCDEEQEKALQDEGESDESEQLSIAFD